MAKVPGVRKAALPRRMLPQLATLTEAPPEAEGWISEIKYDGYRMLTRIDAGAIEIFSRNGLRWTGKLPTLAASLARLKVKQAWLDGEVVALDEDGRSNFSKLKDALGGAVRTDLYYYLFDILHLDGYDLTRCRQDGRKLLLARVLGRKVPPFVRYSEHFTESPALMRAQACELRLEGIITKRADAPYVQKRSPNWLKLKCVQREEFVVVGFTDPKGQREGFGALHMGYYDKAGALHYAGGVGTGYKAKTLKTVYQLLKDQAQRAPPRILIHGEPPPRKIHWVKPALVAETQYSEWTAAGSIRHPIFLGLREDKAARQVVREPPTPAVVEYPSRRKLTGRRVPPPVKAPPKRS